VWYWQMSCRGCEPGHLTPEETAAAVLGLRKIDRAWGAKRGHPVGTMSRWLTESLPTSSGPREALPIRSWMR
jgi:hypothetical protein